ncbi:BLUF domain-containing protein [Actinoplanes sp. RD1]|uniref:BLUF domain-containing protein n=1 Tax=Actinoplanes sp. RD1 TaxID=3064538 RepID=UPI002740AD74|nr:BLUF domain-containing protein [Actinoplanes sp. RD1]
MLSRLIYFSEERDVGVHGVLRILDEARAGNEAEGITGVLAFDRRWFLQCLEGPRDALTRKFLTIARDQRHSGVTLIAFEEAGARLFPDWTMGAMSVDTLDRDAFHPPSMTAATALRTLRSLQATGATM